MLLGIFENSRTFVMSRRHREWHARRRKSLGLCLSVFGLMSCGTPRVASVPMMSAKSSDAGGIKSTDSPLVSAAYTTSTIPDGFKLLLSDAKVMSFVDNGLISGAGSSASFVIPVSSGSMAIPAPIKNPIFAEQKTFLPLKADGSDFWMIESSTTGQKVVRPVSPLALPMPAQLPESPSLSIPVQASPLGFGQEFLILKGKSSLWIIQRSGAQLKAAEVPFLAEMSSPVAAGQFSGTSGSFWIADSAAVWRVYPSGKDWSADKFKLELTNAAKGSQTIFAAVLALDGSRIKFSGPSLVMSGTTLSLSSLSLPGVVTTPVTPVVNATGMTFAEASQMCNACHSSSSTNTNAKAKLSGTENISVWNNNKSNIVASVRDDVMPLGRILTSDEKARFLIFAENPK